MGRMRRILLADDNAHDVELTLEALAEHRLANQVDVVRDGVEALEHLRRAASGRGAEEQPAVVLLDVKMPRMDGLEVLTRMREDPLLRAIPVVMLTSSREERDLARSYQLGVNAYVVKPVLFEAFLAAVSTLGLFWAVFNELPVSSPSGAGTSEGTP